MKIGGAYKFQHQCSEVLLYVGFNFSGNGFWHQFEQEKNQGVVWCEMQDIGLRLIDKVTNE